MNHRRSTLSAAIVLGIASATFDARAGEPKTTTETHIDAAPVAPGPDGWYDANPPDRSFRVRIPGRFKVSVEESKTKTGQAIHTVGVRANVAAGLGGTTQYVTSCTQVTGDKRTQKERLQSVLEHWTGLGGMQTRQNLDSGRDPGLEFEIADDVKVIRSRTYATPSRTCSVLISWPIYAKPADVDIEKYLGSFVVVKR